MKTKFLFIKKRHVFLFIFFFSLLLLTSGYLYYRHEEKLIHAEKHNELKAIASLKIDQIVQWKKLKLSDANFISHRPSVTNSVGKLLANTNNENTRKSIFKILASVNKVYGYKDIFITSLNGDLLFSFARHKAEIDSFTLACINKKGKTEETYITDFYYSIIDKDIHIDIISPIVNNKNIPVALMIFNIHPSEYLYPLIQSWPTPSKSSETLLVRKDRNDVLFINELRFLKDTALKLRIPLTSKHLPAAKAILGYKGLWVGKDYRAKDVIADVRPVPGTKWFMIAKVDADEIYEELNFRAFVILLFTLGLIVLMGTGLFWIYHFRQRNIYKELFNKEKELLEKEELFRTTLYSIGDGVITTDIEGCVRHMNPVAEELTGWNEDEARGEKIQKVLNIINEETREITINPVATVLREGIIVGLANHTLLISKDGREIPIADSGAPIKDELGEILGVVLVFSDQTEERNAKLALLESEFMLRESQTVAGLGSYVWDIQEGFWKSSEILDYIWGIDETYIRTLEGWIDLIHPDYKNLMSDYVTKEVIGKHKQFDKEYKIVRKNDGKERWVHGLGKLLFDVEGNPAKLIGTINDITDRKAVEKKIQDSEERYKRLVEGSPDIMYLYSSEKGAIYWSSRIKDILGFDLDLIKDKPWLWHESIHPDDLPKVDIAIEEAVEGKKFELEYRIKDIRGNWHWFVDKTIGTIKNGSDVIIEGLATDITPKKKIEVALKQSEEDYKRLFDEAHDSIFVFLPKGEIIIDVNERACELYGFSKSELLGMSLEKISKDIPRGKEKINRVLVDGSHHGFETVHYKKDGSEIIVEINATEIMYKGNRAILSINRDVTERKRAEQILKESEDLFRTAFFTNPDSININRLDDGLYVNINEGFTKMTGYTEKDIIGKTSTDINIWVDQADRKRLVEELKKNGHMNNLEAKFRLKNGKIMTGLMSASLISLKGVSHILSITRNIDEIKKVHASLKESEEKYRIVADHTTDWIYWIDTNKNFKYISPSVVSVTGYTQEEFMQNPELLVEIIFEDDREGVKNHFENIANETHPICTKEFRIKTKQGNVKWIYHRCRSVFDDKGKLLGRRASNRDTTELKKAEFQLKESEERFKSLFENATLGIYRGTPDGKLVMGNKALLNILGYNSIDELAKINARELYVDKNRQLEFHKTLNEKGSVYGFEEEMYKADGSIITVSESAKVIKDDRDMIIFYEGIIENITERLKQEESIEKLSRAVEQSQVSIIITDVAGNIEYVNPKFEKITGYKNSDVIGKNPRILKSGEMPGREYESMWKDLAEGRQWSGIFHNKKKNGELFWESANISPIKDNKGNITHYLAVKEDITERIKTNDELNKYKLHLENLIDERTEELKNTNCKLAEEIEKQKKFETQLVDQINLLSTFVQSIPTAAFIKNADLKIIDVNTAFEGLVGLLRKDIIGKTVREVFSHEIGEALNAQDEEVLKEKKLKMFEIKFVDQDGQEKYFIISKAIYRNVSGKAGGILGTYVDISEQKKLLASIERSLAREKELNELKSRFISMASHEFRTPLTSIRIFSDLIAMLKDKNDTEKLTEYIDKIRTSVDYMTDLINDVLTVSRAETGKLKFTPEIIDLQSFCEDIINDFKLKLTENHKMIYNYKTRRRKINADTKLLYYIISNLLSNAVKYSPKGGNIEVEVNAETSRVVISVKDQGIGMSESVMKNLFEPFLRGDNIGSIPGTGLGLSIIKRAIDLHNGQVTCVSELKKGTTFNVMIPIK